MNEFDFALLLLEGSNPCPAYISTSLSSANKNEYQLLESLLVQPPAYDQCLVKVIGYPNDKFTTEISQKVEMAKLVNFTEDIIWIDNQNMGPGFSGAPMLAELGESKILLAIGLYANKHDFFESGPRFNSYNNEIISKWRSEIENIMAIQK